MPYISKRAYDGKTPESIEKQRANLRQNRGKAKSIIAGKEAKYEPFNEIYKNNIIRYLEEQYYIIETKLPVRLEAWQKSQIFEPLFSLNDKGLRKYSLAIVGLPKKNSKSTMASMVANYFLFQDEDFGEILLTANSKEQSSWVILDKLKKSLQMNPKQLSRVKIYEDAIEVLKTGTVARVIAPNYKTSSGTNHNLVVWDELWAMQLDNDRRFWDELTTVPTRKNPLSLVVSYAGFDEDSLLFDLYKKGLAKTDKEMFFFWSNQNLASWVTKEYLTSQRERLRPNTYLRLHENRWTSSESAFVSPEMWDACVLDQLTPIMPGFEGALSVGVDIGYSHDSSAVTAVYRNEEGKIVLALHKCWIPSKTVKLDIEETVERYLKELYKLYTIESINYDPYQFHRSGVSLKKEGLPMCEYAQSQSNLVECGENLYSLIKGRNLIAYKDSEVRSHILKSIAQESSRGFRLVKSRQADRIDLAVSLAMACVKAVNINISGPSLLWIPSPEEEEEKKEAGWKNVFGDGDDDFGEGPLPSKYSQL